MESFRRLLTQHTNGWNLSVEAMIPGTPLHTYNATHKTPEAKAPRVETRRARARRERYYRFPPSIFSERTVIGDHSITIFGWPSRGGLIVLEHANAVDFDFLGLSRFDIQWTRASDPDTEDVFCQKLLLLGARWWDTSFRYRFACSLAENDDEANHDWDAEIEQRFTPRERRFVAVGWPNEPAGAVWIREWASRVPEVEEEDELIPDDIAVRLSLATTMDERCKMLESMGARLYRDHKTYYGSTFVRAWEWKFVGEVNDQMEQTWRRACGICSDCKETDDKAGDWKTWRERRRARKCGLVRR